MAEVVRARDEPTWRAVSVQVWVQNFCCVDQIVWAEVNAHILRGESQEYLR